MPVENATRVCMFLLEVRGSWSVNAHSTRPHLRDWPCNMTKEEMSEYTNTVMINIPDVKKQVRKRTKEEKIDYIVNKVLKPTVDATRSVIMPLWTHPPRPHNDGGCYRFNRCNSHIVVCLHGMKHRSTYQEMSLPQTYTDASVEGKNISVALSLVDDTYVTDQIAKQGSGDERMFKQMFFPPFWSLVPPTSRDERICCSVCFLHLSKEDVKTIRENAKDIRDVDGVCFVVVPEDSGIADLTVLCWGDAMPSQIKHHSFQNVSAMMVDYNFISAHDGRTHVIEDGVDDVHPFLEHYFGFAPPRSPLPLDLDVTAERVGEAEL